MRILIYRLGSLGDTVVAVPCFRHIARMFPEAERIALTNVPIGKMTPLEHVLLNTGLIHGCLHYPLQTRSMGVLLALRNRIRSLKPDLLIYLTEPRGSMKVLRDAVFFLACGIRRMVGVPLSKDLAAHRYDPITGLYEYEAARLARCLRPLGSVPLDERGSWDLGFVPGETARVRAILDRWDGKDLFVSCSSGTKMPAKDWGADRWSGLLGALSHKHGRLGIAFLGARDESPRAELPRKAWSGPSLNLCGELSPRESALVIQRSVLFLGHDSGPMHLASAVDTPCVAIFSARGKPGVWFPFTENGKHHVLYHKTECWGCELEVCTENNKKCITSISVGEVLHAIEAINERLRLFS